MHDQGAASLLAKVMGWDAHDASAPDRAYTLFSSGKTIVSGMMNLPDDSRKAGGKPMWIGYVRVSSFDQNPERQLEHVSVDRLFTDKASGKNNSPAFGFSGQESLIFLFWSILTCIPGKMVRRATRRNISSETGWLVSLPIAAAHNSAAATPLRWRTPESRN